MTEWDGVAAARAADAMIGLAGVRQWRARVAELRAIAGRSERVGKALALRHAGEVALERLRRGVTQPSPAERAVAILAAEAVRVARKLPAPGRANLRAALRAALAGEATLSGLLHLFRVAATHRARGYNVEFAGFSDGTPFDLLISHAGITAEIVCDIASAEEGRDVHRGAWMHLVEALDPDLQTWLAENPGRYLLKLTLPQGLRRDGETLPALQGRIRSLLHDNRRADEDAAAVLRLDPLMPAAIRPDPATMMGSLRRAFGHEAHLAVMTGGGGVCVLAARAGREDEVAVSIRRRMATIAPARLSGTRPGILAMLVEDTDPAEWRHLREQLELEGAARQFLTEPAARHVVAVTCLSRQELFAPLATDNTELRFRNPGHPAARAPALAAAVLST